jgi:hypothetical protein
MTHVQIAVVNWHVVSSNRLAAAYRLEAHGYYFDTMALARDLWEVTLSLAALRRKALPLALISTLPHLDFALPGSNRQGSETYEKAQLAFRVRPASGPRPQHQGKARGDERIF